jgi:hypothetical protein
MKEIIDSILEIQGAAHFIENTIDPYGNEILPNINNAMIVLWSAIEDDLKLVKSGEE